MKLSRTQRLVAFATIFACVAIAIFFAGPTIYFCGLSESGRNACEWAINRHGTTDDARYYAMLWETSRVSILEFHQFPSWNPYHCGGIVLYQDPQSPFPGPLFLLTFFWLPAVVAIKLWVILHLIIGALGTRWLVKDMGANAGEQILCATIVTACGYCAEHFGGGHVSFTPFLFLPWILWGHRRSLTDPRWAVFVAGLFAVSFYEGAAYPIPLMLATVGFDSLARLGNTTERRALYVSLPIALGLFPLLSGARLIPVLTYLREHPRLVPLDDQMTVAEVFQTWLVRNHDRGFPGHPFVWPEYGDYVGLLPVLLMLAGLLFALLRKDEHTRARRIDAFVLVMLVWMVLGNIPGFSLYGLFHEAPIFRSLRVPSRYLFTCNVAIAMIVAGTLITLRRIAAENNVRAGLVRAFVVLEVVMALLVARDMIDANSSRIQQGLDPVLERAPAGRDFHQDPQVPYWRLSTFPVLGVGTPQCYAPFEWGPAPGLWMGSGPQFRLLPQNAGRGEQRRWSPSEVRISVTLAQPATLLVNQNYETSWSASVGRLSPHNGILGVELPAGQHDVVLRHRPVGLNFGILLSLVGLALSIAALRELSPSRLTFLRARFAAWSTATNRPETAPATEASHGEPRDDTAEPDG